MSNFVTELNNDFPVSEIGGKAHSLSALLSHGFNVPSGFVITSSAFFAFLKDNALLENVHRLAIAMTRGDFTEISAQAREAILSGKIPKGMARKTDGFLGSLGAKYVSVRSSAVSEDSLRASFAGLFDTFLNVRAELPLVLETIKKCWASLFNERAVAYRIRKGVPHLEGMAVIIQEMMPAEVSGITFTIHPINKRALLIEASYGIGHAVVSGKVSPDDYVVNKESLDILEKRIGGKSRMAVCQNGKVELIDVDKELVKRPVMPDEKIKEIASICLKVEKIFNYPQDIEWCISGGRLWLLQSRAITGG